MSLSTAEIKAIYCENSNCTLDGKPAKICGFKNQFASVALLDGGTSIEFAWATVHHIMSKDKNFSST